MASIFCLPCIKQNEGRYAYIFQFKANQSCEISKYSRHISFNDQIIYSYILKKMSMHCLNTGSPHSIHCRVLTNFALTEVRILEPVDQQFVLNAICLCSFYVKFVDSGLLKYCFKFMNNLKFSLRWLNINAIFYNWFFIKY